MGITPFAQAALCLDRTDAYPPLQGVLAQPDRQGDLFSRGAQHRCYPFRFKLAAFSEVCNVHVFPHTVILTVYSGNFGEFTPPQKKISSVSMNSPIKQ